MEKLDNINDKYIIKHVLGSGSFSQVFYAESRKNEKKVAIKCIDRIKMTSKKSLLSEIDIHKKLKHPNVVQLLETYQDAEFYYLVMPL
ncbi:hypothetical protein A3Q56_03836 [Intoshia linei]|uniref:Protein kinase domain-containing protein n=1 Tax=Intoshia linei TaxID=1819745 RepID=A0A177B2B6_9BILA|nr:hypothetical protein A3Q56_03836 [Intoshia linei]